MIVPSDPLDQLVIGFAALCALTVAIVYTRHAILRRRRFWAAGRTRPLHRRIHDQRAGRR